MDLSVELLTLAGMLQAEYLQELLNDAGVQDNILADAVASLEETLGSTLPEPEPTPQPQPEPNPEPVTGSAKMSWNAPSTRVNGESLAMGEIEQYIVRYGTEYGIEERSNEEIVEDGQAMEYEVAGLGEGIWYFAIKTIDTNGLESDWSVSVSKTISR